VLRDSTLRPEKSGLLAASKQELVLADMTTTLLGRMELIVSIHASAEGYWFSTNTGLVSERYANKWLAMQDYLHENIKWERENV
jgi:hypothetical protein